MLFKRKSFEVEAKQININNIDEIKRWCGAELKWNGFSAYLVVPTKNGPTLAYNDCYVFKHPEDGFLVYMKDDFNKYYEPA